MKTSPESCRRTLLICAAVIAGVGLGLAVGVIGPVAAEAARGGTPGKAVTAFWVNIGFALLSAVAIFVIAKRPHGFGGLARTVSIVIGLVVMFLGFALADAGSAYLGHGPEMRPASILLIVCAVVDIFAGIVVVVSASLMPTTAGPRVAA